MRIEKITTYYDYRNDISRMGAGKESAGLGVL